MNPFASVAHTEAQTKANQTRTTNGAGAYRSTLSANLDFFGRSGNIQYSTAVPDFVLALAEDKELAIRNLLNTRDVREGKGVRNVSRILLKELCTRDPSFILRSNILERFVELGRWDDIIPVIELQDKAITGKIIKLFATELRKEEPNNLMLKWLPINSRKVTDKRFCNLLRTYLKMDAKGLRQFVTSRRKDFIPEYKFCTKQWGLLDYSALPSQCFRKHREAFRRNDANRFNTFVESAIKGDDPKVKINAGAVYPHELIGNFTQWRSKGISAATEAQWKNLPNFLSEGLKILPLVDVSGSMGCAAYSNYTCMDIAIALGVYLAERNESDFKDLFLTFTSSPSFVSLKDKPNLQSKLFAILQSPWGMSTNIEAAFKSILSFAIRHNVSQKDMPDSLLILSDMQFDRCAEGRDLTAMQRAKELFEAAGYQMPSLVFWNLNANTTNQPVTFSDTGAALVSGFSPSTLKAVFGNTLDDYTPLNVMVSALMNPRYEVTGL